MDRARNPERLEDLADEIENFTEIAAFLNLSAGDIPVLDRIDIGVATRPLRGVLGGDHVIYVDFKKRYALDALIAQARTDGRDDLAARLEGNKRRAGILLADVAGHRITDAMVAAMLHQAFLLGSYYEMEISGHITTRLFEHIKTRFYESTNIKKLVAMIYGEITDQGRFQYVCAGHCPPIVFSREFGRIMPVDANRRVAEALIGMFPASRGRGTSAPVAAASIGEAPIVNEIDLLAPGDILLLATDGLTDHSEGRFVEAELEPCLERLADRSAAGICEGLLECVLACGTPTDDITIVAVKRL